MDKYFCDRDRTIFYALVYSVTIGIVFSCFACCIAPLVLFAVLMEAIVFTVNPYMYRPHIRIPVVLSYFAGWIIGRTIFEQEYCFVNWNYGKQFCDKNCCM